MAIVLKAWRCCEEIYADKRIRLVSANAGAGGASSIHCHRSQDNVFILISGRLRVIIYDQQPLERTWETILHRDALGARSVCVPAGLWHQFEAIEDSTFQEMYLSVNDEPPAAYDIVRV